MEESRLVHLRMVGEPSRCFGPRLFFDCHGVDETKLGEFMGDAARHSDCKAPSTPTFHDVMQKVNEVEIRPRGCDIDFWLESFNSGGYFFKFCAGPSSHSFLHELVVEDLPAILPVNVGILTVGAGLYELESTWCETSLLKDQLVLLHAVGIADLVVCVDNMHSCDFSKTRFTEICTEVKTFLDMRGIYKDAVFVPISSSAGDNVVEKSNNMRWFGGSTFVGALQNVASSKKLQNKLLRLPIQALYKVKDVGVVAIGRVETGTLSVGDRMSTNSLVSADGDVCTALEKDSEQVQKAFPGDVIGVVMPNVSSEDLRHGMIIGHAGRGRFAIGTHRFLALAFLLRRTRCCVGDQVRIDCHTSRTMCRVDGLVAELHPQRGTVTRMQPAAMKVGKLYVAEFVSESAPLHLEEFARCPQIGRFRVVRGGEAVIAGLVLKVPTELEKPELDDAQLSNAHKEISEHSKDFPSQSHQDWWAALACDTIRNTWYHQ